MFAYKWPFLFVHRSLIIGLLRSVVAMSAQEWGICLRGKGEYGFIHYGVQQLSLLPCRLPAPALITGTADLTSPIHTGTAWYGWKAKASRTASGSWRKGWKRLNVVHRCAWCFIPGIESLVIFRAEYGGLVLCCMKFLGRRRNKAQNVDPFSFNDWLACSWRRSLVHVAEMWGHSE